MGYRSFNRRSILQSAMAVVLAAAGAIHAGSAMAQDFPSRAVRIVVPYQAGGSSDLVVRTIADPLSKELGVPVEVDNRPGGGGVVGAQAVIGSPADGYTVFFGLNSLAINTVKQNPPYDVQKDFMPVIQIGENPQVLYVSGKTPASNGAEFLAWAKENKGKLNFASQGVAAPTHIAMVRLSSGNDLDIEPVVYKGSADNIRAIIAGEAHIGMDTFGTLKPFAESGEIKLIAYTTVDDNPLYPDLQNLEEAGLQLLDNRAWYGFFAPAGTPEDAVTKLNAGVNKVLQENEAARDALAKIGATVVGGTPEKFKSFVDGQVDIYRKVIADAGLVIE